MLASIRALNRVRFPSRFLCNKYSSSSESYSVQQGSDLESKNPSSANATDQDLFKVVNTYNLVIPELHEVVRERITSIISFKIDVKHIAWTKICYSPNDVNETYYIEDWNCHIIEVEKQNMPTMLRILHKYIDCIPHADVYVIESLPALRSVPGAEKMFKNALTAQFYAMFCVLISSRKGIPICDQETGEEIDFHNMYYLKSNLTSRFYKYLIGDERVSTEKIVESISEYNGVFRRLKDDPKLSSINIPPRLKENFSKSRPVKREYLGNSLLVGLTFLKLFVEQCSKSIGTLKLKNTDESCLEK